MFSSASYISSSRMRVVMRKLFSINLIEFIRHKVFYISVN